MSETVEATGRTLEEAKRAAALGLGLEVDACDFEVLDSSSKGLFAKNNFRVRATAKPQAETVQSEHAAVEVEVAQTPAEEAATEQADQEAPDVLASDEDAAVATEMVQGIFEEAELDVQAELSSLNGRYVNIRLTGADTGLLISPRNPVLDSLQYLCNAMFSRTRPGGVRITLDAKEYRQKRTKALEELAIQVAEQVVARNQEAVLDSLPAHERRIVHRTLADFEGIETYSEGEEPNRHVVVSPRVEP